MCYRYKPYSHHYFLENNPGEPHKTCNKMLSLSFKDNLETSQIILQFMTDIVFYASLNFVGFYLRFVNEINMRRGFLNKRNSIETTFKLKYEKEQEVNLFSHSFWLFLLSSNRQKSLFFIVVS